MPPVAVGPGVVGPPFRRAAVREAPSRGGGAPIGALRKTTRYGMLPLVDTLWTGGEKMQDEQMYQALMAMTELEAAALAMLEALERAREAMRTQVETYRGREERPQ